jgi:hypothetical protein
MSLHLRRVALSASMCLSLFVATHSNAKGLPTTPMRNSNGSESLEQCIGKYGEPECYCAVGAKEINRTVAQIGGHQLVTVDFQTEQMVSGLNKNFGCNNLTEFKAPDGYVLTGYKFSTRANSAPCELNFDRLNETKEPDNWGGYFQRCQTNPHMTDSGVQFKYALFSGGERVFGNANITLYFLSK